MTVPDWPAVNVMVVGAAETAKLGVELTWARTRAAKEREAPWVVSPA